MSNEWNWHVNSLQTRLNDLQSTIDSIKSCVERRPGLDSATQAIAALIEASNQSEYALQEFPTALSQILADPAIGSLLIGPQGEIVLYNSTAEQLLGRDYLQDRNMKSIQFSSEDRNAVMVADDLPWSRALKGEALPDVRLHLSRPATPDTWINVSATPFRSPQGVVTGAVVFLIDTSEEVQLEGSITTLCNTIHDQIAEVGSTHTQLRDLADRLSNTGIQRILSDSGPSPNAPPRPEEDPTRKKSEPRREAGVSPSAARQAGLPQAAKAKHVKTGKDSDSDSSPSRVLIPPPPLAKPRETDGSSRVIIPAPPPQSAISAAASAAEASLMSELIVEPASPESESATSDYASPTSLAAEPSEVQVSNVFEDSSGSIDMERSDTWSQVGDRFPENTMEAEPIVIPEGSKTLEVERIDIEPVVLQESAAEVNVQEEFPTEQVVEGLPEVIFTADQIDSALQPLIDETEKDIAKAIADQPANPEVVEEVKEVSRWSAEYNQKFEKPEEPTVVEEAPKADFWVAGQEQGADGDAAKASTEGDQVVDSAKSLFGKFANLTKDSYGGTDSPSEKEPDPALPWPELVDGQDYGEPLWDEYTQSEEESTPWQQDKVDEIGEEGALPKPPKAAAPVEVPSPALAQDLRLPTESGEVDFAILDADVPEDSLAAKEVQAADELLQVEPVDEEVQEEVSAPYAEVESEKDLFEALEVPVTEPESVEAADHVAQEEHAEGTVSETTDEQQQGEIADQSADDDNDADYIGAGQDKPSSLKDSRKSRPSASASYNRLKPLSAAAELDGGFLSEGVTEQVVRFSSDEFAPVDESGPRRVLVVDDIPVNQKLLLLHLKRLGYEADVANNGQEALDMLAEKPYELILMDCDMPVMSGFEAASRIRSNEAYSHRRIPIIALTSYDREGDKEKCIASGMDDYITKGASQKELKDTIERSMVSARMKGDDGEPVDEVENEADLAPLDITAMLKLYGREEVEEISRLFLSNMGTYIECMQLAIDNKDGDSVAHFANAVKGPCAALGMRLMTRLTSDIMAYAESQDWTQVRVKYMRLKAVFVQTREELKKVCPDDSLLTT